MNCVGFFKLSHAFKIVNTDREVFSSKNKTENDLKVACLVCCACVIHLKGI